MRKNHKIIYEVKLVRISSAFMIVINISFFSAFEKFVRPRHRRQHHRRRKNQKYLFYLYFPLVSYMGSATTNQLPMPSCIIATSSIFTSASPLCVYAMLTVWNALPPPLSLNFAGLIMMRILSTFP